MKKILKKLMVDKCDLYSETVTISDNGVPEISKVFIKSIDCNMQKNTLSLTDTNGKVVYSNEVSFYVAPEEYSHCSFILYREKYYKVLDVTDSTLNLVMKIKAVLNE